MDSHSSELCLLKFLEREVDSEYSAWIKGVVLESDYPTFRQELAARLVQL